MIGRSVVKRYAKALFGAAMREQAVDRVESDLGLVSYVLESNPDLRRALHIPLITAEKKKAVLRGVFSGKVHQITLDYMCLLADKRREDALAQTEAVYVELANEARGIVEAQVTTAVELVEQDEIRLAAKLSGITGKQVHLVKSIDPSIIGGIVVRIQDKIIDGSVRGQLAAMREKLLG
jgi:F-type H+-transporting ATPase subunit delta